MQEIINFYHITKNNFIYSPWVQSQNIDSYLNYLKEEINELKIALINNDNFNIKEELGDILWNSFMLLHIANNSYNFNFLEILDIIIKKMKNRKPHIFEKRRISLNEEIEIWNKAKKNNNSIKY